MVWAWQHPAWPDFTWDAGCLWAAEQAYLRGGGVFVGTMHHLSADETEHLIVEALTVEAVTTSEIEGEVLDRASVQSSIRRALGLAADARRARPSEAGIAAMMVDLHRTFDAPLSHEMMFGWHRMVTAGHDDLVDVGCYRRDPAPMQVVSGPIQARKVHFEAPPSAAVTAEMDRFVAWFNDTAPHGQAPLPALTRAGIAHFYFVCIHPFEDGNGRVGRAVAEKALAQGHGRPTLTALAATILATRSGYYDALERSNRDIALTGWLAWFAETALEAQRRAIGTAVFLIDKTRYLDGLRDRVNARQMRALLRMLQEGPAGFKGGLSAGNYVSITGAPSATATRDLADLVDKGALVRTGERRHTRYWLTMPARPGSV